MKFLRTHFLTEHLRWLLLYKAFNKIEHFFRYNKINIIDLMGIDDDEIVKARSLLVVIIKACPIVSGAKIEIKRYIDR